MGLEGSIMKCFSLLRQKVGARRDAGALLRSWRDSRGFPELREQESSETSRTGMKAGEIWPETIVRGCLRALLLSLLWHAFTMVKIR